jgi:hypothetical protein
MMLQILFNHFFRHLPNCGAEFNRLPIVSSPISLLQMWKLLEQSTCRIAFDPPHNLTGCHSGRGTHQNMHMILANYTAHDPYLKRFTNLTNHCSNSFCNIPLSKSYSGISSPKQNDTQFEKPYDCHTCSP